LDSLTIKLMWYIIIKYRIAIMILLIPKQVFKYFYEGVQQNNYHVK